MSERNPVSADPRPAPYDVDEAAPTAAFGVGTDETLVPTRWRFGEPTT